MHVGFQLGPGLLPGLSLDCPFVKGLLHQGQLLAKGCCQLSCRGPHGRVGVAALAHHLLDDRGQDPRLVPDDVPACIGPRLGNLDSQAGSQVQQLLA